MGRGVLGAMLLVIWMGLLAGCGPVKPSTPEMFYGNCIMVPGRDLCGSDQEVCRAYQEVVTDQQPSALACRQACNRAARQLGLQYLSDDCAYTISRGNALCEQQCLRLYP